MKKVIVFGIGDSAELIKYYFENDELYKNEYKIIAFTIDKNFKKEERFLGLPLVEFGELEKVYPPDEYYLFNTIGYSKMNTLRERKYIEGKKKGYKYVNYISSKSIVNCEIGENNFIEEGVVIQPFVKIGNNNVIRYGTAIGHHTEILDNCFLAPRVAIAGRVKIENNCFLGINSTIFNHLEIKAYTLLSGGSVLKRDTKQNSVYITNNTDEVEKESFDIKL